MTPGEDVVERVARAMLAKLVAQDALWRAMESDDTLSSVPVDGHVDLKGVARAALEAMREPTEAMKDAGVKATHEDPVSLWDDAADCYRAMIDVALSPYRSEREG